MGSRHKPYIQHCTVLQTSSGWENGSPQGAVSRYLRESRSPLGRRSLVKIATAWASATAPRGCSSRPRNARRSRRYEVAVETCDERWATWTCAGVDVRRRRMRLRGHERRPEEKEIGWDAPSSPSTQWIGTEASTLPVALSHLLPYVSFPVYPH